MTEHEKDIKAMEIKMWKVVAWISTVAFIVAIMHSFLTK